MAIKALKCPNCGGIIEQFDETMKKGFCPYCDSIILDVQEKQIEYIQQIGRFQVEGISTIDNLLARAEQYLSKNDFIKTEEYTNRILDLDINNQRAIVLNLLSTAQQYFVINEFNKVEEYATKVLKIDANNRTAIDLLRITNIVHINDTEITLNEIQNIVNKSNISKKVAIKELRLVTGLGLNEANKFVEIACKHKKLKRVDVENILTEIKQKSWNYFVIKE